MVVDFEENQGMNAAHSFSAAPDQREFRLAVLSGIALSLLFAVAQVLGNGTPAALLILPVVALLLLALSSPELALVGLTLFLFIDLHLSLYVGAVLFTPIVALAVILHHRDFAWNELSTPLSKPLLLFGLAVLPSLFNALNPVSSIAKMYNLVAFLIAMYAVLLTFRTFDAMRRMALVFLVMTAITGTDVIRVALATGLRDYGFAGVMFVDYAGIAVNVVALMVLFTKGWRRVALLILGTLIGMGLILAQTRNAWIATGVTLAVTLGLLIRDPLVAGVTRKRMVIIAAVCIAAIAILAAGTIALNPSVGERATDITEANTVETPDALIIRNTLLTRMIIWDTALNAFLAHPFIGIGMYGFIDASYMYCRFPTMLYEIYVRGNSAHIAYLGVAAESGLIGLTAFLFLLVSTLRLAARNVRRALSQQEQRYALLSFTAMIYCTLSMFLTDAWMFGQGIVLFGIVVGLILAQHRHQQQGSPA